MDAFALNTTAATYSSGRYTYPLDITVRNTGLAPAAGFQVRFSDNGGWRETRAIASLAPGASTVLHLDWDLTGLLNAGQGQANIQLTATTDPQDIIVEAGNLNNVAQDADEVDVRPRLTQVRSGYRPGTFLAGVSVPNNVDAWVDWNGDLAGTGSPGEPGQVTYELNGTQSVEPVGNPAAAPAASHTYNMGSDLQAGTNVLRVRAENAVRFRSDSHTLTLHGADNAAWLASLAVNVEAEPPGAAYDKVAVYKSQFEWLDERLEGYYDVPADKVNVLKKEYGPKIDAWSLSAEFRSDGAGTVEGSGEFEGEVKGTAAVKTTVRAAGSVRADEQLRLIKLEGSLRGEGDINTPRVPLTPWLPFLYAQAKIGAGADATLGVYEQAGGELAWSPLVLGLDATVEGTLSAGWEHIAYVEGGVGGQPRGEFNLPPDPDLLRSLTIRLHAWGKAQFLVWEKGYEAEYEYVVAGPGGQAMADALEPHSGPWQLRARDSSQPLDGAGRAVAAWVQLADGTLPADPHDVLSRMEIVASVWGGVAWSVPVRLTDDGRMDLRPKIAAAGNGSVMAAWLKDADGSFPLYPDEEQETLAPPWPSAASSATRPRNWPSATAKPWRCGATMPTVVSIASPTLPSITPPGTVRPGARRNPRQV